MTEPARRRAPWGVEGDLIAAGLRPCTHSVVTMAREARACLPTKQWKS